MSCRPRCLAPLAAVLGTLATALLSALLLLAWPLHAAAGVPHDRAVPAYAEEQTILQLEQGLPQPGLGDGGSGIDHTDRHTLAEPGRQGEYGVILQRGGNTWRTLRNGPLAMALGGLLALTLAGLAAWHLLHGPQRTPGAAESPVPDRPLLRFTRWQRWVHWTVAVLFVLLALTGLVVTFGKGLLLPWMGHDVFAAVAIAGKWVHNVAGPLFVVASVVMVVTYLRHNRFERADGRWLLSATGLGARHAAAPYFNAGEKLWFWLGVTGLGLAMGATGLLLNFPYLGDVGDVSALTRYQLQWANGLHIVGAALYIAFALGHVYLGTLGSPGAWQAMAHGTVSARWAHAHHRLWYERLQRGEAGPPQQAPAAAHPPERRP